MLDKKAITIIVISVINLLSIGLIIFASVYIEKRTSNFFGKINKPMFFVGIGSIIFLFMLGFSFGAREKQCSECCACTSASEACCSFCCKKEDCPCSGGGGCSSSDGEAFGCCCILIIVFFCCYILFS